MKKLISICLVCVCCMALSMPTLAYNYGFDTGADTLSAFGKATSNDNSVSSDPMTENTRRNKDAALLPPPYFYGSGDIPTDVSSLYHDNMLDGASSIGNSNENSGGSIVASGTPTDTIDKAWSIWGADNTTSGTSNVAILPTVPGFTASTSTVAINAEPLYYANGSIGSLTIARTGKTITVYEGEQLDNLAKGAGHFATTSAWDGNIGLCGHNRGTSAYFSFVKDMKIGDKATYTTRYGSRTYEVISKTQIDEYDHTPLAWSAENLLTLITCVENKAELRWAVQLREVE